MDTQASPVAQATSVRRVKSDQDQAADIVVGQFIQPVIHAHEVTHP